MAITGATPMTSAIRTSLSVIIGAIGAVLALAGMALIVIADWLQPEQPAPTVEDLGKADHMGKSQHSKRSRFHE